MSIALQKEPKKNEKLDVKNKENITKKKNNIQSCGESCAKSLISSLISGKNLNEENNFRITSNQANQVAKLLQQDPSQLASIKNTPSSLRDQSSRDSILYVFSRLPAKQVTQVAQNLSASQNTQDKIDALSLLQPTANKNLSSQSQIQQVINNENDPDVLLKAIKISHSLNPDAVDSVTQRRLSNLINSNSNDQIKSAALITKTKVIKGDSTLQSDIKSALTSPSKRFSEAGLQALNTVLNQQKKSRDQGTWQSNQDLRRDVDSIANNPHADPSTRVEALNLIRRHYHNR